MIRLSKNFFSKDYFFGRKNSNYHNYNQWDNDRYWQSILRAVEEHGIKGRILDVGCAFGFLLKRLKPYFEELYGVDISRYAIQHAQKQAPSAKLAQLDLNTDELPCPDQYFDLITALDVLEHTETFERSLKKINQKLTSGGYLIISTPVKDTWAGKFLKFFDKDISHINILSRKELFAIIKRSGLKIIEKKYFLNLVFFKLWGVPVDVELVLRKKS